MIGADCLQMFEMFTELRVSVPVKQTVNFVNSIKFWTDSVIN